MRDSSRFKPISDLKVNADRHEEAEAVLRGIASHEVNPETVALLKVVALGDQEVATGKVKPAADVVARLRTKRSGG